jgi:hypothetical protein
MNDDKTRRRVNCMLCFVRRSHTRVLHQTRHSFTSFVHVSKTLVRSLLYAIVTPLLVKKYVQ